MAVRTGKGPRLTATSTRLAPRLGRKRAVIAVARRLAEQLYQAGAMALGASPRALAT